MAPPPIADPATCPLPERTPVEGGEPAASVVALVGNPRRNSRTRELTEHLSARLVDALGLPGTALRVVDLAEFGGAVLDGSPAVDEALATVTSASVLVAATPVYKASYTGLLKSFLDRLGGAALRGVAAVPMTVAGAPIHRLVADVHLRPLLVELGASTPTRAFAVEEAVLADPAAVVEEWVLSEAPTLARMLRAVDSTEFVATR
ncbi:FMN reductase [Actinopolymorpha cephalotaxi]|uniref:FMN reductase n=1 Tax=Actinopolymorpha cephalotaxi TaxID=504797 RepID=A0A1I2LQR4_9ACTN|nr:NAD(P)H-dependent oxidoreductase [Actinopolymorpha cephalotaxi]NYH81403.1 FMN reductase [Actinopolymorpha cephalotaxi]SFF81463.1 FMN reductase [Actinopolymorpha cephalotaxi]